MSRKLKPKRRLRWPKGRVRPEKEVEFDWYTHPTYLRIQRGMANNHDMHKLVRVFHKAERRSMISMFAAFDGVDLLGKYSNLANIVWAIGNGTHGNAFSSAEYKARDADAYAYLHELYTWQRPFIKTKDQL